MKSFVRAPRDLSLFGLGLVLVGSISLFAAAPPDSERRDEGALATPSTEGTALVATASDETELPSVDVLTGMRSRQLGVAAEGTGDGRMLLSLTNRTKKTLRVVLPPSLVASGATGQFGGGGGRGGRRSRGMGMGGMGMGMGGMGMGMGGMGMGGMGMGMGGGGMMGGGTMPASMGMITVGRLIMTLVGDRDSWDQTTLMSGMMGGMGMGGMGRGGMGMGMGMGGRGGGFRSVPAGPAPATVLQPNETRRLPTVALSLDGPRGDGGVKVPAKGEPLRIGAIDQLNRGAKSELVVKRLAEAKAPETVAQLVLWRLGGVDWSQVDKLSRSWANPSELALAKQFVARLDRSSTALGSSDAGHFYWDEAGREADAGPLTAAIDGLLRGHQVLGLQSQRGVPAAPSGPALACRLTTGESNVRVEFAASDERGRRWISLGAKSIPLPSRDDGSAEVDAIASEVVDSMASGLLERITRVTLVKGPKSNGKSTYAVRIDNGSPLILSGLAIAGAESAKPTPFAALGGLSLSPSTSTRLPISPELVERLGLKQQVRAVAADLGGL